MGCSLRLLIVSAWGILASEEAKSTNSQVRSKEQAKGKCWTDDSEGREAGMGYAFKTYDSVCCNSDL